MSSDSASACAHCALPVANDADYCCIGCRLAAAAGGAGDAAGWLNARLVLSAFLAAGVMEFDCLLYSDALFAPAQTPDVVALRNLARFAVAALTVPVMILLGVPLAKGAWADARRGLVRMDGLIVLATAAAFALSLHHTFEGTGDVYYETATMTLLFVTLGRRLEAHARTKGKDAASALEELLPRKARRICAGAAAAEPGRPSLTQKLAVSELVKDGLEDDARAPRGEANGDEEVEVAALAPGDFVRVAPGAAVPADVVVVVGRSEIRAAHLTGEETPRAVGVGDEIPAGAVNATGALVARVVRRAQDGMLGRVRELLDAPLPATRETRIADRLAAWLFVVAVALAAVGGTRSCLEDGAGAGVRTALSVLLVACPCALGIATPLAYRAMRASLARRGVLVRDPVALEAAAAVDFVVLDKTGTLTDPSASRVERAAGDAGSFERMSALVGHSGHALAACVGRVGAVPSDVRLFAGAGVEGRFGATASRAGSPEWMDRDGVAWDADAAERRTALTHEGATLVAYAEDGRVRALGAVVSTLRPGAREAVAELRGAGVDVEILSGDHQQAVNRACRGLGARQTASGPASNGEGITAETQRRGEGETQGKSARDASFLCPSSSASLRLSGECSALVDMTARGGLSPEDKVRRIEELRVAGRRVLMAGDGVNDAPALHAADVGVAVACGTALARSEAQVEVLGDDLRALPRLVRASRKLRRTVRGNLACSVAYNAVALVMAASGHLPPLVAVAAMIASSLAVSVRSYRLLDWERSAS